MTDYFALLDQPRRPWLDSDALKEVFQRKTLREHPDAQASAAGTGDAEAAFALINTAHQSLQDPKLRLQHLLALEGHAPTSRFEAVPEEIADLFPAIAAVTQDATQLAEKTANAASALSRSLLAGEVMDVRNRIETLLATLIRLHAEADAKLEQLSAGYQSNAETLSAIHRLYIRYSYLRRWIAQLEEQRVGIADR